MTGPKSVLGQTDVLPELQSLYDKKSEHLCIGDTIMICFSERVFKEDLNQQQAYEDKNYVEGTTVEEAFIRD